MLRFQKLCLKTCQNIPSILTKILQLSTYTMYASQGNTIHKAYLILENSNENFILLVKGDIGHFHIVKHCLSKKQQNQV